MGLLLAAALALPLAGCGKKAGLDPPPGEPSRYPRVYPEPEVPPLVRPQTPPPDALSLPPSQRLPGTLPQ